MNQELELRMYGLVPYNISPIQQGIQYGHALQEFNNMIMDWMDLNPSPESELFNNIKVFRQWAKKHKTFIILNGGTTNNKIVDGKYLGSLNNHKETLDKLGVLNLTFNEPDLGDQLTAIVFLVDERIFNKEKYPYFEFKIRKQLDLNNPTFVDDIEKSQWEKWVETIGGMDNLRFRNFITPFKLA